MTFCDVESNAVDRIVKGLDTKWWGPICELSRRLNQKHKTVKITGSLSLLNFDVDVTDLLSTIISLSKNWKLEILCKI
jgi:hypothetical protein